VAFKQLPALARSQEAYDRFSAATNLPLTLLALLWLPLLVLPLVMGLPAGVVRAFNVADLVIWALYGAEYLVRLYLVPARKRFVAHHLIDLAVVVLPVLRPLRALRLLRLLLLTRASIVLVNALRRVRGILTHRGLHFVLMAVTAIVVVGSGVELIFEQHARGFPGIIHASADPRMAAARCWTGRHTAPMTAPGTLPRYRTRRGAGRIRQPAAAAAAAGRRADG